MLISPSWHVLTEGPGLKILSREVWYGPGYCGICGDTDSRTVVPTSVRYWDCDDGWRIGVLCVGCAEDIKGPQPDDYAYPRLARAERIDATAALADMDSCYSDSDSEDTQ